jgi:hypothetical protein
MYPDDHNTAAHLISNQSKDSLSHQNIESRGYTTIQM